MVYHHFPQGVSKSIVTNTNFPPQNSGGASGNPTPGGTMEYENFVAMEYEDLIDMDYEA